MRRKFVLLSFCLFSASIAFNSCAKGISPAEAANGKAKCGRYIR